MANFSKIIFGDGLSVTDEGDGVIRVDAGTTGVPAPSSSRATYSATTTVSGTSNAQPVLSQDDGDSLIDLGTYEFLESGVYALHFVVHCSTRVANAVFNLTADVNNAAGPSGFFSSDFPMDGPNSSHAWGCLTIVWYAAAGDGFDFSIFNGDSSSHSFSTFFSVQKIS